MAATSTDFLKIIGVIEEIWQRIQEERYFVIGPRGQGFVVDPGEARGEWVEVKDAAA